MEKLTREVRFLKIYALILTPLLVGFLFMGFRSDFGKQRFEEIVVERINVVEKDGTLKMVIANGERQHPGLVDGKEVFPRKRYAGLIFFNSAGMECGGLTYDATKEDGADMGFSFDQYRNDQILQLQYSENIDGSRKYRTYGLKLWDENDAYPLSRILRMLDSAHAIKDSNARENAMNELTKPGVLKTERLFVGRTPKEETGLFIRDDKGNPRIMIYVDQNNKANIVTLDEQGHVQQSLTK